MHVEIISQVKKFYEADCYSITLPSIEGEITVLEGHENLVTLLDVGAITIRKKDQKEEIILINGGMVHVSNDSLKILVNDAAVPEQIKRQEIENAMINAKEQIASRPGTKELIQLEKQLRFEMFKKNFLDEK